VPLFVEELIKTLLESEVVREVDGRYVTESLLPPMAIPTTLRDSLMARLDRLAPVKAVAQAAACIGREFSHALLASIVDTDNLDEKLDQLVDAGLVFRRGSRDLARFVFKHALVQDAAYESLLKTKRRNLHARIAKILADKFSDKAEIEPELLAHHYTEAGLAAQAVDCWQQAGRRAIERSGDTEAISHLNNGLKVLETLPESPARDRKEIALRVVLGVSLLTVEDGRSPEAEQNYLRARALCEEVEDTVQLFPAIWGLWYGSMARSDLHRACELADQLLEVGRLANDSALRLQAHHCQWTSRFLRGELPAALEHTVQGMVLYRADEHHASTFTYGGHDPGACSRSIGALALWLSGCPEQASERQDAALELAGELGHPATLHEVHNNALRLSTLRRDGRAVRQHAEAVINFRIGGG